MNVDPNEDKYAFGCDSSSGPSFGYGGGIHIANNSNTRKES